MKEKDKKRKKSRGRKRKESRGGDEEMMDEEKKGRKTGTEIYLNGHNQVVHGRQQRVPGCIRKK